MVSKFLVAAAAATLAVAQRPENISMCDYYTTALLKDNTAANQDTLLTLVVNTAVIGNYTQPNVGIAVPGILAANQTYNGVPVNLVPYFDGSLKSTNGGGSSGISVNFLDGGAAAPLLKNMPANDTSSAQYKLLTHLYSYFGLLLGCSELGQTGFPAYAGRPGMYDVHKFMDLDVNEVGYFIQQVGLSAASFGVTDDDVKAVGASLNKFFGYKCSPKVQIIPTAPAQYQAICIDDNCPLAPNATCAAYPSAMAPMSVGATSPATAIASTGMPMGTGVMASGTGVMPGHTGAPMPYKGAASGLVAFAGLAGSIAIGAAAYML
nr:hypothetical protein CFP56_60704 [Quercus suber]